MTFDPLTLTVPNFYEPLPSKPDGVRNRLIDTILDALKIFSTVNVYFIRAFLRHGVFIFIIQYLDSISFQLKISQLKTEG